MPKALNDSPLEDWEQADFVVWLNDRSIKHFRVPNETFTKSWSQKRKNKALGVQRGVQDIFVLILPSQSRDGEGYLLGIEMKRQKGSTTSKEQKEWEGLFMELGLPNVQPYICKGSQAAQDVVRHYLSPSVEQLRF